MINQVWKSSVSEQEKVVLPWMEGCPTLILDASVQVSLNWSNVREQKTLVFRRNLIETVKNNREDTVGALDHMF